MAKQRSHPEPPQAPFKQSQAPGKFTNSVEVQSLASAVPFNPVQSTQQGQVPFPAQPPPIMNNYHRTMFKPMELPKFTGKACDYVRWRQRFLQVVDSSLPEEYRLVRLREAVNDGEAASLIADLLGSPGAYQAACLELESWFGSSDREMEQQVRDLMQYQRITSERDLEGLRQYAIKIRSLVANLHMCETQPGPEICIIATEKIPNTMLVRYFEANGNGNTDKNQFATWLLEKVKTAKYASDRTEASNRQPVQTRKEIMGSYRPHRHQTHIALGPTQSAQQRKGQNNPNQTKPVQSTKCRKCNGPHQLKHCNEFKSLTCGKRNDLVRMLNLCMCCLKDTGHVHAVVQRAPTATASITFSCTSSRRQRRQQEVPLLLRPQPTASGRKRPCT